MKRRRIDRGGQGIETLLPPLFSLKFNFKIWCRTMSNSALPRILFSLLVLLPYTGNAQTCKTATVPANTPDNQFVINADATVKDLKTGLIWKRCSEGQTFSAGSCIGTAIGYTWQQALQQAQNLNAVGFAGAQDWRVPNIKELSSILERQCNNPAINLNIFPDNNLKFYWSSSSNTNADSAWVVSFMDSTDLPGDKSSRLRLRLVRSGQ